MMYFFKYQFGFRKSHSTEQAIMEITDNLKASIDSNFYILWPPLRSLKSI